MDTLVLSRLPINDGVIDWAELAFVPRKIKFIQLPQKIKQPEFWKVLTEASKKLNPCGTIEGELRRQFAIRRLVITNVKEMDFGNRLVIQIR